MTPEQRKLKQVVDLFGGAKELAQAMDMYPSSITRRINGEIKITRRDLLSIEAAAMRRMESLRQAVRQEVTDAGSANRGGE